MQGHFWNSQSLIIIIAIYPKSWNLPGILIDILGHFVHKGM